MRYERALDIAAGPSAVWLVLSEVERWPEWTPSVTGVEPAEPAEAGATLAVATRWRVTQPRMPVLTWVVTEVIPDRSFVWESSAPGLVTAASHILTPVDGGTRLTLMLEQRGWLAGPVGVLTGARTRRYVNAEAEGLKRRCESGG